MLHKNDGRWKGCQNLEIMLAFMMCLFPRMDLRECRSKNEVVSWWRDKSENIWK